MPPRRLSLIDRLLLRVARRLDWAKELAARVEPHRAEIDPTAVVHPTAEIDNKQGDPAAIRVGAHTHVRGQLLTFWDGGSIRVGEWCYIGHDSRVWSQASVSIGNYVLISHQVDVHDTDGHPLDHRDRRRDVEGILSGGGGLGRDAVATAAVVIEDDVWVGFKASVLKGVRIGRGAIVAAGSIVTRDVAPWTLVGGVPARLIRALEPDGATAAERNGNAEAASRLT
jgi:maltose O-acetyltransferase